MTSFILYACAALLMIGALLAASIVGTAAKDKSNPHGTGSLFAIVALSLDAIAFALMVIA